MKPKKPAKRKKEIVLKSDKSFDDLIDDAFNDKSFKKRQGSTLVLTILGGITPKKKTSKRKKK